LPVVLQRVTVTQAYSAIDSFLGQNQGSHTSLKVVEVFLLKVLENRVGP